MKKPPFNAGDIGDMCSIPGLGRSPGVRHKNQLQYSCLENSMDRGAWWATVHGVAKSWDTIKPLSKYADSARRWEQTFLVSDLSPVAGKVIGMKVSNTYLVIII